MIFNKINFYFKKIVIILYMEIVDLFYPIQPLKIENVENNVFVWTKYTNQNIMKKLKKYYEFVDISTNTDINSELRYKYTLSNKKIEFLG